MSPATLDYWATLGSVLWKIGYMVVVPMALIYLVGLGIIWLLKKGGVIDI